MDSATLIGLSNETYEILEQLGEGGFGEVYLARKQPLGKLVALKLLQTRVSVDDERRLWDEAMLLASLHHPGIVAADDLVRLDGRLGLVTEYVEGEDLSVCLSGRMPASTVVEVVAQVAWALHAAAQKGVVHRDVKPQNVRIGRYGNVKLLDFGSARAQLSDGDEEPTREVNGTPRYMAPERFQFEVVPASDVFSLGCILWLGVKRRHFYGDVKTFDGIFELTRSEERWAELVAAAIPSQRTPDPRATPDPSKGAPTDAPELDALLVAMLSRESEARPTAIEVARRCEALLEAWPRRTPLAEWCRERWNDGPPRKRVVGAERTSPSLSQGGATDEDDTTERSSVSEPASLLSQPYPLGKPPAPPAPQASSQAAAPIASAPAQASPARAAASPIPPADAAPGGSSRPALIAVGFAAVVVVVGIVAMSVVGTGGSPGTGTPVVPVPVPVPEPAAVAEPVPAPGPASAVPAPTASPSPSPSPSPAPAVAAPRPAPAAAPVAKPPPSPRVPTPEPEVHAARPSPAPVPSPVPTVRPAPAAPKPAGGLSDPVAIREMVSKRMAAQMGSLDACYTKRVALRPDLTGRWRLTFSVATSGATSDVSVASLDVSDAELESCVAAAVRAWSFDPIAVTQPTSRTVRFPSR